MAAELPALGPGEVPDHAVQPEPPYAHSANARGVRQGLREHLEEVARLAEQFAASIGADSLARTAGLWHDLGKYNPEWQRYLLESEAGTRARGSGPDHKGAGSCLASRHFDPLAVLIAGHHGGLLDRSDVKARLNEWRQQGAERTLSQVPAHLISSPAALAPPSFVHTELDLDLFVRMLFSTLVDADYLDTERHMQAGKAEVREAGVGLGDLWTAFEAYHERLPPAAGAVGEVRGAVYQACLDAAVLTPGIFRLTVPTGGGKTLSSMAFALRHSLAHGLRRVVVAVPFTSITEQTAAVYREAFGIERVVLEHHSAIAPHHLDDQSPEGLWGRLASENWDAPVVVTTTVQLFESLFAAQTSRCRKLHRLAGSVIILDEAQALPAHVLAPILDVVRALTRDYGASMVLCTATQPALDDAPGFAGLPDVREIAPDPPVLFAALRRVEYELPTEGEVWPWARVAEEMLSSPQGLAIVNTIADSQVLFDVLDDPDAHYLSTLLCGAHRREVLAEVRARLRQGRPCRLVSTQVIEAGVDVDFPLVLRAMGPLDRIVQAAGRCNREGRLAAGRVVVFLPEEGHMPPGSYRTGADVTALELRSGGDLHDPELYYRYFRALFGYLDLDEQEVQKLRRGLRWAEVAKTFRMIDEDRTEVAVEYDDRARALIERVRGERTPHRWLLRALQPYLVGVRTWQLEQYRARGLVDEIEPSGILVWVGEYDRRRGLTAENRALIG